MEQQSATAELNTLDGVTATTSELNTLDGITSTVGELNVLDGVTATTTELNVTDGLTASTAELNQLDGKTISNVLTPANNNDIPTSSAVNTYVSGLLNALGGFVAIPNEASFPTTNPDPSDNAGTVVSIADAGGLVIDNSGTSTSGTTTGNAAVTITGFPSSLHSTTLGNDLGLQVQTTSTLNTYTYHKLIAKETDITQLSDDINDFNARYRVSASAPTTDLDAGDLWFDTTAGKMKVYDANDSAWEEVQSVGNFSINTLSSSSGTGGGSATFNGSAYRFTLSNAGATAQQMLVSVNGVVQKPNSGTSQPSEALRLTPTTSSLLLHLHLVRATSSSPLVRRSTLASPVTTRSTRHNWSTVLSLTPRSAAVQPLRRPSWLSLLTLLTTKRRGLALAKT